MFNLFKKKHTEKVIEISKEILFTCKDCNKKIYEKENSIYHCNKCGLESPRSEITTTFITTSGFTFCKNCYEKFEVINNARRNDLLKDFINLDNY